MDDAYTLTAAAYLERNPVKAGLVAEAAEWPWSSAAGHVAGTGDALAEGRWLVQQTGGWVCSWREHLAGESAADTAAALRLHENTGRPLGSEPGYPGTSNSFLLLTPADDGGTGSTWHESHGW